MSENIHIHQNKSNKSCKTPLHRKRHRIFEFFLSFESIESIFLRNKLSPNIWSMQHPSESQQILWGSRNWPCIR